jgi:hypothetical protein
MWACLRLHRNARRSGARSRKDFLFRKVRTAAGSAPPAESEGGSSEVQPAKALAPIYVTCERSQSTVVMPVQQ